MCRLAAYTGPSAPLSRILFDPPHSLDVMSYAPRQQQSGVVNVDGTGVAWFADDDAVPLVYRGDRPPWSDPNLPGLAPRLRSRVMLGAVRSATPGLPQGTTFVHPFTVDGLAGTHNGWISDFRQRVARPLVAELSDEAFAGLSGLSDTTVLFLLAVDAHRAGAGLLEAAQEATERATKVCLAAGSTATLTLVLADHTGVAAVNAATGRPANSLYAVKHPGGGFGLASEPLDPADPWVPVPEGGTAILTPDSLEITT